MENKPKVFLTSWVNGEEREEENIRTQRLTPESGARQGLDLPEWSSLTLILVYQGENFPLLFFWKLSGKIYSGQAWVLGPYISLLRNDNKHGG